MRAPIGVIDLDAIPEVDEAEMIDTIKCNLAGFPDEDQIEIMEIARDLFTDEELKPYLG